MKCLLAFLAAGCCVGLLSGCNETELAIQPFQKPQIFLTEQINPQWTFREARQFIEQTGHFDGRNLQIISRVQWGANTPTGFMSAMNDVIGVVIHHTATDSTVKDIQVFHQQVRQWSDIGYHFIVAKDPNSQRGEWRVYEGRELRYQGAHTGGRTIDGSYINLNEGQIGISVMGNFEEFSASNPTGFPVGSPEYQRQPPMQAVQVLGDLVDELSHRYPALKHLFGHGLEPNAINPGYTQCPGEGQVHLVGAFLNRFGFSSVYERAWVLAAQSKSHVVASGAGLLSLDSQVENAEEIATQLFHKYLQAINQKDEHLLSLAVSAAFLKRTGGLAAWKERFKFQPPSESAIFGSVEIKMRDRDSFYASFNRSWFLLVNQNSQWVLDAPVPEFSLQEGSE